MKKEKVKLWLAISFSLTSILAFAQEQKQTIDAVTEATPSRVTLQDSEKSKVKIEGICKEVLKNTEWVAIATWSGNAVHLVGTWGDYVEIINDDTILIPVGGMQETEKNLKENKHVQILVASKKVQGSYGLGKGCVLYGEGEIQTEGEYVQRIKMRFPWVRGALVIKVEKIESML